MHPWWVIVPRSLFPKARRSPVGDICLSFWFGVDCSRSPRKPGRACDLDHEELLIDRAGGIGNTSALPPATAMIAVFAWSVWFTSQMTDKSCLSIGSARSSRTVPKAGDAEYEHAARPGPGKPGHMSVPTNQSRAQRISLRSIDQPRGVRVQVSSPEP